MEHAAKVREAGVGRTDITPPAGAMLEDYRRPGPSVGVLDRLHATVLVLRSAADGPVALVAVDHIGLTVAEALPLRERVGALLGTGAERVMALFSHTHLGARATPDYLASLREAVSGAAE